MASRLYRSKSNKVIAGVAGGLADYIGMDPTLVRLLWVLIGFTAGIGFVAYIIAAIIIPEEPVGFPSVVEGSSGDGNAFRNHGEGRRFFGIALVGIGAVLLLQNVLDWMDIGRYLWPLILIGVGALIFNRGMGGRN